MTDGTFDGRGRHGTAVRALANWCGAGLSLALVAGLAFWGWQLLIRDVTGVPVVRAIQGPMRIAPETPGGQQAEHQGLTVNRIAEKAADEEPVEQVRLAPAAAELLPDDMPVATTLADLEPDMAEVPVTRQAARPAASLNATDRAVAEALGLDPASFVTLASATGEEERPEPRPAGAMIALSTTAAGDEVVQLGAFDTEEVARREWDRLSERFPDVLERHHGVVERVDRGGKTFWRLRAAGFYDLAEARRVCAALNAGQADCIPVVRR
ncbi:SPOR domain-containing protein [Roseitranquillus sediminis]|uniref:SPOR domain-containing protein n=1 Tax=Roseitranquillus sediminis TaxID=2809051 RepID=UPI001D0C5E13|nr:SPOR domain-containing protein [Roseitranquillus sediminis]MBM9595002.1 SPOR domain-containing protein [Roseitranquillus sediminis]